MRPKPHNQMNTKPAPLGDQPFASHYDGSPSYEESAVPIRVTGQPTSLINKWPQLAEKTFAFLVGILNPYKIWN